MEKPRHNVTVLHAEGHRAGKQRVAGAQSHARGHSLLPPTLALGVPCKSVNSLMNLNNWHSGFSVFFPPLLLATYGGWWFPESFSSLTTHMVMQTHYWVLRGSGEAAQGPVSLGIVAGSP